MNERPLRLGFVVMPPALVLALLAAWFATVTRRAGGEP